MMENTVYIKKYSEPPFDMREILRYARSDDSERMRRIALECINEIKGKTDTTVCYRVFPIKFCDNKIDLGFAQTQSIQLRKNLESCESVIVFAATVGIETDRLISFYSRISPVKAVFMQAIGAERIETLCDVFNDEMKQKYEADGYALKPRFSPGYGDLPLNVQKDIFSVLDCQRKIGLTLNENFTMSPSKSVTALIGIEKTGG